MRINPFLPLDSGLVSVFLDVQGLAMISIPALWRDNREPNSRPCRNNRSMHDRDGRVAVEGFYEDIQLYGR
jgi:hypothetical protein